MFGRVCYNSPQYNTAYSGQLWYISVYQRCSVRAEAMLKEATDEVKYWKDEADLSSFVNVPQFSLAAAIITKIVVG